MKHVATSKLLGIAVCRALRSVGHCASVKEVYSSSVGSFARYPGIVVFKL
jgi:hypothetical protein